MRTLVVSKSEGRWGDNYRWASWCDGWLDSGPVALVDTDHAGWSCKLVESGGKRNPLIRSAGHLPICKTT